jgi:hypothetical protein
MKLEEMLEEFLRLPATLDEAIAYIKKNPVLSNTIEEMAFKQTIVNVLILAGIVSENDFNASVNHFKEQLYEEFGKELLKESEKVRAEEEAEADDDWDEWSNDKNIPQA